MSVDVAGHRVRFTWMAAAGVLTAAAIVVASITGASGWLVALGLIGPDLAFLAAIGQAPVERGRMPSRAVPVYNALHHPAGPLALGAVAAASVWLAPALAAPLAVLALSWLAHIVWDRSVGYGLRDRDGAIIPPGSRRAPSGTASTS